MIGRIVGKALLKGAAKKTAGKKALTFAQRNALRKAQKESARLRKLAAKRPDDFYAGTTTRKVMERSVKLNKKNNTITFGKPKLLDKKDALKHHRQIKKQFGINSNLYNDKQLGNQLTKAVRKQAYDSLPTSTKVAIRAGQAAKVGAVGYLGYNAYKETKRRK